MNVRKLKHRGWKNAIVLFLTCFCLTFAMPVQAQQPAKVSIEFAAFFEVEGDVGQPGVWIKKPENYLALDSRDNVQGILKPNGDFHYEGSVVGGQLVLKGRFNKDMTKLEYMTLLFHQSNRDKKWERRSYSYKLVNVPLEKKASVLGGTTSSIRLLGDEEPVRKEIQQYVRDVSGEWQFPNGKSARIKRWLPDRYYVDQRIYDPNTPTGPKGLASGYKVPILKVEVYPEPAKPGKSKKKTGSKK